MEGSTEKRSRPDLFVPRDFLANLRLEMETQYRKKTEELPDGLMTALRSYIGRGALQLSGFHRTLFEGAFVELALKQGRTPEWIGVTLGMLGTKDPIRSTRIAHSRFVFEVVTKHLPRLRHYKPEDHSGLSALRSHIRAMKDYLEKATREELAWWREGELELPPMLRTVSLTGKVIEYVDPEWLMP